MKVLNEEINKDIFGIEKKIEFEINGEIYNYEGFSQSESTYLNKIFDKKNDLILNEICDLDDYILFVNKDVIDEKHFTDYNQNVDDCVFGSSLLMPRNEYDKVINEYTVNKIINTEIIADYFQVTLGNAIGRGHTIGYF